MESAEAEAMAHWIEVVRRGAPELLCGPDGADAPAIRRAPERGRGAAEHRKGAAVSPAPLSTGDAASASHASAPPGTPVRVPPRPGAAEPAPPERLFERVLPVPAARGDETPVPVGTGVRERSPRGGLLELRAGAWSPRAAEAPLDAREPAPRTEATGASARAGPRETPDEAEARWPDLPDAADEHAEPDLEAVMRALDRRSRLDREQRGA